jgi:Flp pilus assembly protein TadB
MDPGYFLPLEQTPTGHLLVLLAGVLWVASALWARKILAVQL